MDIKEYLKKIPGAPRAASYLRKFSARPSGKSRNDIYDEETVEVMKRVLSPASAAIDIGANRGSILHYIVDIAPNAVHYAIEPLPGFSKELRAAYPDVVVHECAVSDKSGGAEFNHVTNSPAYSGLLERTYDRPDPIIEKIRVRLARLDDLIPDDAPIDLIKIDIEGGEYHAMKGGSEIISHRKPVIVFEAGIKSTGHYGVTQNMIFDFLDGLGMRISTMKRWLHGEPPFTRAEFHQSWENDYYFIAYSDAHW
jgi:FkbM family methyltransferase